VFARVAGVAPFVACVTLLIGWTFGDLAQPAAYSSTRDDTSDLGALTADSAWLFNQVSDNLTGLLIVVFAIGLWRALSPDVVGRLGATAVAVTGFGAFLDGLFRLDCRGIDANCVNDSWHAHAHKIESGVTAGAFIVAPLILAFAFRRNERWRGAWLPTLLIIPVSFAIQALFSIWGDGAAVRAGTLVGFAWMAYVGALLWRRAEPVDERRPQPV